MIRLYSPPGSYAIDAGYRRYDDYVPVGGKQCQVARIRNLSTSSLIERSFNVGIRYGCRLPVDSNRNTIQNTLRHYLEKFLELCIQLGCEGLIMGEYQRSVFEPR